MDQELCQKDVSNGSRSVSFHKCGRPVKDDGLCGLHLGARARSRDAYLRRLVARNEDSERRKHVEDILGRLGVDGKPEYSTRTRAYTGDVVLTIDELLRITTRPND